jgi:hypothetical protein
MSRFLTLFYGDDPVAVIDRAGPAGGEKAAVGPIRSCRLPYEDNRSLFNGFQVMAGASSEVGAQLSTSTNHPGVLNLAANRFEWTTEEDRSSPAEPFCRCAGQPAPNETRANLVQIVTSTTTAQEFNPGEWKIRFYAP